MAKKKQKRLGKITKKKQAKMARTAARKSLAEWGRAVRACGKCAVCGIGEVVKQNVDGTPKLSKRGKPIIVRLNAHHLLPKESYSEYKLLPVNGCCLCPKHHKYFRYSAHRNPLWFSEWLRRFRPKQYRWCIKHMGKVRLRLK
jgi:hypothetical protein